MQGVINGIVKTVAILWRWNCGKCKDKDNMTREIIFKDKQRLSYDYENQVWIVNGKYTRCGHAKEMKCNCYGRLHEGETAIITEHCR
jgi:hypothetical protein